MSRVKGEDVTRWVQAAMAAVIGGLAMAGLVWAGGGQSQKLDDHLDESGAHLTPAIHRELGAINSKLTQLLKRID
jgi:hypothetical protein